MGRVSGLILMILKSYSLPGSSGPALFSGPVVGRKLECPSSRRLRSSISVLWQSASMFSPNSTNAPKVAMRETLPFTIWPTLCCLNQSPQMSFTCLMPSDTRRFSGSIFNTFAVISSPFLKTSCGFFTRPVQLTSPTCTSPSKPSSISMNAPNSAMLRTLPVTTVPTGYFSARRIFLRGAHPGIGHQLFQAERYPLLFLVKLQDDDVEFLFRFHHVRRVLHAAPAQIRQVQQAVDSAQVHERTVFGYVLHVPVHDLAFAQLLHQFAALGMQFFFEQRAAAHHHVAAAAVQFRDAHLHFRAGKSVQVLRWPQVKLRSRKERAYPDIHHETALDAVHHFARNRFLGLERRLDLLPGPPAQHFQVGQNGEAILVFPGPLHFDHAVRLGTRNLRIREFRRGHQPFGLSAKIHDDAVLRVRHNLDLDHLARRSRFLLLVVLLQQLAHLFRAGSFLGRSRGFRVRRVRFRGRLRLFRSGCRRSFLRGIHGLGRFAGGASNRFSRAFHRRVRFWVRAVRSRFGFRCWSGGSRIGQVVVVGKHGCWPPEDDFVWAAAMRPPFSRINSLLVPYKGLVQGGSPQSGYLGHRCCGRRKRCNLARILAASRSCQSICNFQTDSIFQLFQWFSCSRLHRCRARSQTPSVATMVPRGIPRLQ